MGLSLGSLFGGSAVSNVLGTAAGGLAAGGLGYLGVKETNRANQNIASARNLMEIEEAKKAREFSRSEAITNREFQERMSNTAVSRRMKDMKEAGINPILAGKFDASSPAGNIGATAKANAHGYEAQNKMAAFINSAGSLLDIQRKISDIENIEAQTNLTNNKTSITGPISELMGVLQSLAGPPASDAKSIIPSGYKTLKNVIKGTASDIGQAGINSAKALQSKSNEVMHKYKSWWNNIKSMLYGTGKGKQGNSNSIKRHFERGR